MNPRLIARQKKENHNALCWRYQRTEAWKEYQREYQKQYYKNNPKQKKKHKKLVANWRKNNRELFNQRVREYYQRNKEKCLKYSREYSKTHRDTINAQQRARYAKNKKKMREYAKSYYKKTEKQNVNMLRILHKTSQINTKTPYGMVLA